MTSVIPPGGTIGIFGGGQLGRMTTLAAAELGYRTHIFCPEPDSPAGQVATATTQAGYDDDSAIDGFAAAIDVATFEFENIPAAAARRLAERCPIRPSVEALEVAQDRLREKAFLVANGVAVADHVAIRGAADLARVEQALDRPYVLKTARLGYDGKGQARVHPGDDAVAALETIGGAPAVAEALVLFERELSVIAARGLDGAFAAYDVVENHHVEHILDTSTVPADITGDQAAHAVAVARGIAEALDYVGILAVELFALADSRLLVNEIAPRPHNSGHWTIDACTTSQFEQHVRAICGLPLGASHRHADVVMRNLLGDAVESWRSVLTEPDAKLHIYGKREARRGRKMGHVTYLSRPR